MDRENIERNLHDDEINLYDLWRVIAKRKNLIIGLFLVSVITAAVISLLLPKIYRAETILLLEAKDSVDGKDIISAAELVEVIGKFNRERVEAVCPNNAQLIAAIKLAALKGSKDRIRLTVESRNNDRFPHIFSEVLQYINNNSEIKRISSQERERLQKQKKELSLLLTEAELTRQRFDKFFKGGKLDMIGFNPIEVDKSIHNLKMQIFGIDQSLEKPFGVQLIDGVILSKSPVRPKTSLNIVLAGFLSLFAGIFLAFFLEFIQKAKNK